MATTIYDVPEKIKVPQIKFDGSFNLEQYNKEVEQFIQELKNELHGQGYTESYVGEIIRFPVADSNAEYMVIALNPVMLVHLPLGDAWHYDYIERLTAKDILLKIQQQKSLAAMFSNNKKKQSLIKKSVTMKEPKVVLKNLKTFVGHDTMIGFNADVWINNVKCQHVYDAAFGGDFEYTTLKTNSESKNVLIDKNIQLLEEYVDQLPEAETSIIKDGKPMMIKYGMDVYIDRVLEKQEKVKNQLKFNKTKIKKMATCILIGKTDENEYRYYNFKRPLSSFPVVWLQQHVDRIKKKDCTDGIEILNTNLTDLGINV